MPIQLFHYWRSSASWRVRWGLEIKKIPHEKIAVNLLAAEEKNESYLKKNPSGYLPCLIVDSHPPLGESISILEWMEENYPAPSFFQGDSYDRAKIRQMAETINSGIQPLQNLDVVRKLADKKEIQDEWVKHWIERGLLVYENLVLSTGKMGKFSVGDSPTLADICLIPQCYSALRFQVDLGKFPAVKRIYENALSADSCKASHPDRFQP
jgi:maleylacetoacetate isomerase